MLRGIRSKLNLQSVKYLLTTSTSTSRSLTHKRYNNTLCIDSFHVPILSDGFAVVNSPYTTHIQPLHPSEYIEDEDFLVIVEEGKEMASKASARVSLNLHIRDEMQRIYRKNFKEEFKKNIRYERGVVFKNQRQFLEVSCQPQLKYPFPTVDISLTLELPVQFNWRINALDYADVYAKNLEGGWVYEVMTNKGNCHLSNIKGTDIHVQTAGGDIICPSYLLAEFGTLATEKSGKISVEKLQGRKFCLDSDEGSIYAGSMYLQRGEVKSHSGVVKLGDIHGNTEVKVRRGNISIRSVSGDLLAATGHGNVFLHLSQFHQVNLKASEGYIKVTLEEEEPSLTALKIKAQQIDIDPKVKLTGTDVEDKDEDFKTLSSRATIGDTCRIQENSLKELTADAKRGSFKMDVKSWFSSLELK